MFSKNNIKAFALVILSSINMYAMQALETKLPQELLNLNTKLISAAQAGTVEATKALIALGADNNESLKNVVKKNGTTRAIETLIAAGTSVNHQDPLGYTPLHIAVANYEINNVITLLAHGANPDLRLNDQDYDLDLFPYILKHVPINDTPLELALRLKNLPQLSQLISLVLQNLNPTPQEIEQLSYVILSIKALKILPKDVMKQIMQFKLVDAIAEQKLEKIKTEMLKLQSADNWNALDKAMLKKAIKVSILREFVVPNEIQVINRER